MFIPALIMLIVLAPVLLPAMITVVHLLTGKARISTRDRIAIDFPRRAASPLAATPAAA